MRKLAYAKIKHYTVCIEEVGSNEYPQFASGLCMEECARVSLSHQVGVGLLQEPLGLGEMLGALSSCLQLLGGLLQLPARGSPLLRAHTQSLM